ncbi:MAG: hypothetical protein JWO37_859 [Acidimicrobiales bacterium]|nr:hypothetical protein [Acidimicrobiales bacterium]
MDDADVIGRIDELVAEEHRLESQADGKGLSDAEITRLRDIEVGLDQCWDLLRQRRARRASGEDPDSATVRPAGEVEGYLQ